MDLPARPGGRSFPGLDVRASRPADAEVAEAHRVLSTPPDGRFTGVLVAMRRDDTGAEVLRGIQFRRTGEGAFSRDLASYGEWRAALESLGVSLAGAGDAELRSLHARMLAVHAQRAAARRGLTARQRHWVMAAAAGARRVSGRRRSRGQ